MALFEFFLHYHYRIHYRIQIVTQSVYTANAYLNIYLYMINSTKYASNKKTQVLGYKYGRFRGFCGYGDSVGIPTGFCCEYGMGMGIEIQSPRQPCKTILSSLHTGAMKRDLFYDCRKLMPYNITVWKTLIRYHTNV